MPLRKRAAQFAPFAALVGYEALLSEAARVTEPRRELSEDERALLDARVQALLAAAATGAAPAVEIMHFVADPAKPGGRYVRTAGHLVGVASDGRAVMLAEGIAIACADIAALESETLDKLAPTE